MKLVGIVVFGISLFFLSGCTTLHTAASKGNVKAIDRLVEEGYDLDETDEAGMTPLIHAINMNQKESVSVLLKNGADVNAVDTQTLNSPLHYAIMQGNNSLVRVLLEQKADITLVNNEGKLPYDLAYEKGNMEMAELLKVKPLKASLPVEPMKIAKVKQDALPNKKNNEIIHPLPDVGKVASTAKESVLTQKVPQQLSDREMSEKLNKMIKGRETIGIRNFLNENPQALELITDSNQKLRYIGPPDWRVIDIADKIRLKEVSDEEIINHITTQKLPYKKFTPEEISILLRYGMSYKIINAMMDVS